MKKYTLLFALLLTSVSFINAQEKNDKLKNTKEETITKTVTVKGVTEETTETKIVKKEKQIIEINDSGVENQNEVYSTKKKATEKEVNSKSIENKENDAAISEQRRRRGAGDPPVAALRSVSHALTRPVVRPLVLRRERGQQLQDRDLDQRRARLGVPGGGHLRLRRMGHADPRPLRTSLSDR